MAVASIEIACFRGDNPPSLLERDANGYCWCIVGAFDILTRNGGFYPMDDFIMSMFEPTSPFMRRVKERNCVGELDHPDVSELKSSAQKIARMRKIDLSREAVHHAEFKIDVIKDEYGKSIYAVRSRLKPSGPYEDSLERKLNNPEQNVCFSIRSITLDDVIQNQLVKKVREIITYDVVSEGGVKTANKHDTANLGLEDLRDGPQLEVVQSIKFTPNDLDAAILASKSSGMGLESEHSRLTYVKDALGWNKIQVVNSNFLKW